MKHQSTIISTLLLAIGIIIFGFSISYGITHFKSNERHVTVKGLSERVVKADEAIWTLRFSASNDDLKELYKNISSSQSAIKNFIQAHGFQNKQLQVLPVNIVDNSTNAYNTNQHTKRFQVYGQIVLFSNDVDRVIETTQETDSLVDKGVIISSSDVQFNFAKFNQIKPEMLDEATVNAKRSADTFAKNSNSKIAGIRHASQGTFSITSVDTSAPQLNPLKKIRIVTTVEYYLM